MQNDLSLIYMQFFHSLIAFVCCSILLLHLKLWTKTPTTTAYWRVAVDSGVFQICLIKRTGLMTTIWIQSMNEQKPVKTIIERYFLTCTSINFQFDDCFCIAVPCNAELLHFDRFPLSLPIKSNHFFFASNVLWERTWNLLSFTGSSVEMSLWKSEIHICVQIEIGFRALGDISLNRTFILVVFSLCYVGCHRSINFIAHTNVAFQLQHFTRTASISQTDFFLHSNNNK